MRKILGSAILLALMSLGVQAAEPAAKQTAAASAGLPTVGEIDTKFGDLVKKRVGLSSDLISGLKDPFYEEETRVITLAEQTGLVLTAVIGEKVKINGSWYHPGDTVGSLYTITNVKPRSVVLSLESGEQIELNLNQGNRNVIITNN